MIARNMTREFVRKGIPVKHMLIGDLLYANATATIVSVNLIRVINVYSYTLEKQSK